MEDTEHIYGSLDGLLLKGSFQTAQSSSTKDLAILFVHGITADRNEGGFYFDFAKKLSENGFSSLRFDLRSHGASEGKLTDLTLFGGISDIAASKSKLKSLTTNKKVVIVAASFGGGLAVIHAARQAPTGLVLLNPNLDYAANWLPESRRISSQPILPENMIEKLRTEGWVSRGESRLSRAMLNEILHVRPADYMSRISCPALTIHGNKDSMVSFDIAQDNHKTAGPSTFVSVIGADHGFISPGNEDLSNPQTLIYRAHVIERVISWLIKLNQDLDKENCWNPTE